MAQAFMSQEMLIGLMGALIGAVVSGLFGWLLHRSQQASAAREELRGTISTLVDLREEFNRRMRDAATPVEREMIASSLNNKRQIYLQAAEDLVAKVGTATQAEYAVLGGEFAADSDFRRAEQYFVAAAGAAESELARVSALRWLGMFYFGEGPMRNPEKARGYFRQGAELVRSPGDSYSWYVKGLTYEAWGMWELMCGNRPEGERRIGEARGCYEAMAPAHPLRQPALESMHARVDAALGFAPPGRPTMVVPGIVTGAGTLPVEPVPSTVGAFHHEGGRGMSGHSGPGAGEIPPL